jgi:hypothetical protein
VNRLSLNGLQTRPSQVWGGVRLVPLVRETPIESLRLHPAARPDAAEQDRAECLYEPHGLIAEWTADGAAVPAVGTALRMPAATVRRSRKPPTKLERHTRIRFVPHQVALDAYLPLSFQRPAVVWKEWSSRAFDRGLPSPRENRIAGRNIVGLADALRVFEIHPGQCGVLVYVADALAGVLVTPHPEDYRALHPTLIEDSYGELIWRYAHLHRETQDFTVRLGAVASLADLRAQVNAAKADWGRFHDSTMAAGLLDAQYAFTETYRMTDYTLWRFRPQFDAHYECHIGESITHEDGRLAYLHSFRLSETQIRRGRLLRELSEQDWNLEDTAASMGLAVPALAARIDAAGYGGLLRQDVMDHFRALNVRFNR